MSVENKSTYQSYLLRMWPRDSRKDSPWQFMLENPHSGERHGFAGLAELVLFLQKYVNQNQINLKERTMSKAIGTSGIHHITLTVSDIKQSTDFYTQVMGFQVVVEFEPRIALSNGSLLLVLTPPPDPAQAIASDRFNENRIGLDHLSLSVDNLAELEAAATFLEEQGVSHGEIHDLGPGFGIYVMALRDPDNIQLELTAPHGD